MERDHRKETCLERDHVLKKVENTSINYKNVSYLLFKMGYLRKYLRKE